MTAPLTPADFDAYRDEIGGCECTVCVQLAYLSHHWSDKNAHREAARALLAHLVAGTHERVTLAERAQLARTAKADRLAAAYAIGASTDELAAIERGYVTVSMAPIGGMGVGIGNAPIIAERAACEAANARHALTKEAGR